MKDMGFESLTTHFGLGSAARFGVIEQLRIKQITTLI